MCLLSPREVGPGAEASPRARRGHSRHTASDCVTLGAVYSSPARLWDAYVRREGAQPRTGQRPREDRRVRDTGFGAESAQQSVPTAGRGRPDRAPPGPRRSSGHLLVFGNLLRGTEQLVGDLRQFA